ncbi:unnamed protein product [Spirodela intermedia]|uniref:Uncharacterized protein n=1 Tax=Spirodela intermedia TaxID=51605 RepID=A0A7I8INV6_SPIIN|nr:unnamed protein product [Spirodela intermedia]CAA6658821.1 unnamed protein product [Spirodela intermedia]
MDLRGHDLRLPSSWVPAPPASRQGAQPAGANWLESVAGFSVDLTGGETAVAALASFPSPAVNFTTSVPMFFTGEPINGVEQSTAQLLLNGKLMLNGDLLLHGTTHYINGRASSFPQEETALVPYSANGTIVIYEGQLHSLKKVRPKVILDAETNRMWNLLMGKESNGVEGTEADKKKWWEEERRVFRGRADSFIAKMHLVQRHLYPVKNIKKYISDTGDRRFSPWKGSVLDSVIGVFLTQNVSDHLSSSAFMSMAARFPPGSRGNPIVLEEKDQVQVKDSPCSDTPLVAADDSNLIRAEEIKAPGDVDSSKASVVSSQNSSDDPRPKIDHCGSYSDSNSEVECSIMNNNRCSLESRISFTELLEMAGKSIEGGLCSLPFASGTSMPPGCSNLPPYLPVKEVPDAVRCFTTIEGGKISNHRKDSAVSEGSGQIKKRGRPKVEKVNPLDWDGLRREACRSGVRKGRSSDTMDSLDWEAVKRADVDEISRTIRERGMNNMLAERIKGFLDRLENDHGSIDLEWLRDVPPAKANYPMLETIQKYLWPRLCTLDQRTLYELHYQMITFGKVFCTKSRPNCNACPMRGECKHFASAFASARLALPGPEERRLATSSMEHNHAPLGNPYLVPQLDGIPLRREEGTKNNCEPIIEEPDSPEPECTQIPDIEDGFYEDPDEIPVIRLNIKEFSQNLQDYMQQNSSTELQDVDFSKALVMINQETASIPVPKLKNVSRLRTEHRLDQREAHDPCPYLLAIWTPGETAQSVEPPESCCSAQSTGKLCEQRTCFSCNSVREAQSQTVRGTLLVFADHESSLIPIDVPRSLIWSLPRRTVYFGTSIPTIFRGLAIQEIQNCFWRGFVCVRGFDRKTRGPRPLMARLHFPASKVTRDKRTAGKDNE